ncbi:Las1-like family-containing protein [Strongyloides ratti]|uniref:Las1-like family-containing protein n=1 Tax=Strongyloides ratti TaxID=34506 RepID=A0A090MUM8_STRRB|nr:Las1-like family-containing protein [Strongyloides ratti]CEF62313.1 Las1-like family-containing protein [Strongyloides ratti]
MKRRISFGNNNRQAVNKDDAFLPFHPKQWKYLKDLVINGETNPDSSKKIIDLLIAMEQRDAVEGRLGLALTYEIYNSFYHLHKLNRNNNTEGAALQSVLACALQRSVNHLHDVYGHLEGGPSPTYRRTMEYFKLPSIIASYRNDIAHGKYPTIDSMIDAMVEIRKVVINCYWKPFEGNPSGVIVEDGKETLFADFVRKSRIFILKSNVNVPNEEDERLLKDMVLKSIEYDFDYFGKSFFSPAFAIEDLDGFSLKALPHPVPYSDLNINDGLNKLISLIYHSLKKTGNVFYFCVYGFQSIFLESSEFIKKRKESFFVSCIKKIIKEGHWFSICEIVQLLKWELNSPLSESLFEGVASESRDSTRIAKELEKLMIPDVGEFEPTPRNGGVSDARIIKYNYVVSNEIIPCKLEKILISPIFI